MFSTAIILYLQAQIESAGFQADEISDKNRDMQPVKILVDKCLEDIAVPGVYYMGTQGGYISPPLDSLTTETNTIPYYYKSGSDEMPSLSALENQIASYVEGSLPICLNDFETIPNEITQGEIRATAKINEQNVLVKVYYPLTMKVSSGQEQKLENFVVTVPVRLGHIYDVAKQLIDKQIKNPDFLDMTYLASFDVNVDILPFDGTSTIFAITDGKSKIKGVNYQLFFANAYI